MLRRSVLWAATNIPRSAWDPAHHNPNWSDSYAADIADRRHWPAKKWLIGLEPKTPSEWLKFSKRNLAYAYNGALRSCSTFPEMLVYYKEMKTRGVKVDVDTMNALLTRAARYERIDTEDVFLLFDELSRLGARPDIAVLETLHTVLDHSLAKPFEFREARRRQLVELYNYVAMEEMTRLGPQHAEALLASQMKRLRGNLRQLSASLSPSVYRRYFASIDTFERLVDEVHNFLWEFVSPDHPNVELPALRIRIPFVGSVMRRPAADARPDELSVVQFEDADVCSVLQAALERAIDRDFHDKRPVAERRAYLSLLTILTSSGVLYTSDLMAQLMDVVKYSREDAHRDLDAQRLLRFALRGSSSTQDDGYRELWRKIEPIIDGRVVGRYIAARNPWSLMRICFEQSNNKNAYSFNSFTAVAPPRSTSAVDEVSKSSSTELLVAEDSKPSSGRNHASSQRTPEALSMRWADIKKLVKTTGILTGSVHDQKNVEVFTGMAVFLRTAATGQRYGTTDDALAIQAVGAEGGLDASADKTATSMENLSLDLCRAIFQHAQELHGDMEKYISEHKGLEPEFEYWEAQLILMRVILDCCVMHNRSTAGGASTGGAASEELFKAAAEMRVRLVEESRTRFNGRMRILWLQEV